ncbi:uncharacterized protein AMSG_01964 [Thecamonas trahens ATCC 50062]|uniref:ELMO domain-containing protein n=1 Tax=Thecamonas trahens ATCC 50062 TaxID=461836 RepID=A0A0L0DU26_THETB|nr:hypothetical protein AMSG_01964 [Thecamonas trahens ATCC 50062]KNC55697.1 hypothetical protein AMSG_01964 [Thecamonas trahens ATCC 50062]|eukprot:XP_013761461.1 hypothetical protein AMSG_01964 [Thecamonas trahens ATCC 50062]
MGDERNAMIAALSELDFPTEVKNLVMDTSSGFAESSETRAFMTAWLEPKQALLQESFSYDKTEHADKLAMLWHTVYPTEQLEGEVTTQWKKFGFANADPRADMNRTGVFGLHCLHYMCCKDPVEFATLIQSQQTRTDRDYPLAGAAMSMADLVAKEFALKANEHDVAPAILLDHPNAVEEIFCVCVNVADQIWVSFGGEYIDYPMVVAIARKTLQEVLGRRPSSIDALVRAAGQAVTQLKAKAGSIEETFAAMGLTAETAETEQTLAMKAALVEEMMPVVKEQLKAVLMRGVPLFFPPSGKVKQPVGVRLQLNSLGSLLAFTAKDAAGEAAIGGVVQVPVASIADVVTGGTCPMFADPKKQVSLDKALSIALLLATPIGPEDNPQVAVQFAATDRRTFATVTEGIRSLLGRPLEAETSIEDAERLADMQLRIRLIELDGDVNLPTVEPALPPPPPSFAFVVPEADLVLAGREQPFRVPNEIVAPSSSS